MPFSQLLKRSFEVVSREPALWVLGAIVALFGGGGSVSFNFPGGGGGGGNTGDLPGGGELPAWFNLETLLPFIVGGAILVLLLAVVALVVQSVALAGLIYGADRAAGGVDVRWRELWHAGWTRGARRIVGLKVLLALPTLLAVVVGLALLFVIGAPLFRAAFAGQEPSQGVLAAFLGAIAIFIPFALLMALVGWALQLVGHYAARAIVLGGQPIGPAVRSGWTLLRHNIGNSVIFSIMLAVISAVLGFAVAILFLIGAAIVGIPLFLLLASQEFALGLALALGVPAVLVLVVFAAALSGPLVAYIETAWTLAWRHLTAPQPVPALEPSLAPA